MWPGPYGDGGSRKYLLSSLDQSLTRIGVDYVDIFYSHRPDPSVPIEETMGALHTAVTSGQGAVRGHLQLLARRRRGSAQQVLADLGTPLLIHQPSYSMFNRHVENVADGQTESLLDVVGDLGIGTIVFSPLAQGLLTGRYLSGDVPADSRAAVGHFLKPTALSETYLSRARALNEIAAGRGQSLAQLALSWVLRDDRITSALVGASSVAQLEDNVKALSRRAADRRRDRGDRPARGRRHGPLTVGISETRRRRRRTRSVRAELGRRRLTSSVGANSRSRGGQMSADGRCAASHVSWRAVWWASPPSWWLYG